MQRSAPALPPVLVATLVWAWSPSPAVRAQVQAAGPAPVPAPVQVDGWAEQIQQENERERKAYEALNEQHKREALERDRMEAYRQGQDSLRQQENLRRYQSIQGNR